MKGKLILLCSSQNGHKKLLPHLHKSLPSCCSISQPFNFYPSYAGYFPVLFPCLFLSTYWCQQRQRTPAGSSLLLQKVEQLLLLPTEREFYCQNKALLFLSGIWLLMCTWLELCSVDHRTPGMWGDKKRLSGEWYLEILKRCLSPLFLENVQQETSLSS